MPSKMSAHAGSMHRRIPSAGFPGLRILPRFSRTLPRAPGQPVCLNKTGGHHQVSKRRPWIGHEPPGEFFNECVFPGSGRPLQCVGIEYTPCVAATHRKRTFKYDIGGMSEWGMLCDGCVIADGLFSRKQKSNGGT